MGKSKIHASSDIGDISLQDFANSKAHGTCARIKKAHEAGSVNKDLDWFDKDLEDFVVDSGEEEESEANNQKVTRKKKSKASLFEYQRKQGNTYPLDVWYVISSFIPPEDVGRFASICKGSAYIVSSAGFWSKLYKKHYKPDVLLPQRLQPESIRRPYSLRACVVRSLFHTYQPFKERLRVTITHPGPEPHVLKNGFCSASWYRRLRNGQWEFFFKIRMPGYNENKDSNLNLLEMLSNINANSENGCKVLSVVCNSFILFPTPVGQALWDVKVGLSGMMNQSVKLSFTSFRKFKHSLYEGQFIELHPALKYTVMDWWHPDYPQMEEVEYAKQQEEDLALAGLIHSAWDDW